MAQSPFYGLASEALAVTTRLLDASSLFALAKLSGDKTIWKKCAVLGGVSEIHVDDERSLRCFILNCVLMPAFSGLTEICITTSVTTTWIAAPFQQLTKTMRHIRLNMIFAFDAWLRPVNEQTDSPELKFVANQDGLLPISLKDYFPTLQTLELVRE